MAFATASLLFLSPLAAVMSLALVMIVAFALFASALDSFLRRLILGALCGMARAELSMWELERTYRTMVARNA